MQPTRTSRRALAAALILAAGAQQAAAINATDPEAIRVAMQDYGFAATLGTDSEGDPMIRSRISQTEFQVLFFGCEGGRNCSSILFRAGYDVEPPLSALTMNEWNRQKRFGKAYIDDEGDPFLEMDVNMAFDGLGEQNFQDTLDWWRVVVENFEDFIGW